MTVPVEEAPAKYVPAAAVIRMEQALSGFIGRKACVGGFLSRMLKAWAQPIVCVLNWKTRVRERRAELTV